MTSRKDVFIVSDRGLKAKGVVAHEATHLMQIASGRLALHPEKGSLGGLNIPPIQMGAIPPEY